MSADNGIYILQCKDQYRVIEASAIENLYWSFINRSSNNDIVPTRIVEYYGNCKYTRNKEMAQKIADNMLRHTFICEYGISTVGNPNKTWMQIVREAKEYAKEEIKAIEDRGESYINTWRNIYNFLIEFSKSA